MLLGREAERRQIEFALARARAGTSSTLVLVGEPGIGKTALLDFGAAQAAGMEVLRAAGVQSEADIPFASLLELLRPALVRLDDIPEPQRAALEVALAVRHGPAPERFAVGAATLSLLAACAERAPLLVLLDDAQWLDRSSAHALRFALRRLLAEPIAVLISVRAGEPSLIDDAALPVTELAGLSPAEAQLLTGLPAGLAARLHSATGGNPLAMLELAGGDLQELAIAPEHAPLLVSAQIADAFRRRFDRLEDDARRALTLAATSDTGELAVLERAGPEFGADLGALDEAEQAGLVRIGAGQVVFRHPLARSAVYASAGPGERRAAHRALAHALPDRDVDRRAWHLAAAATGPEDAASDALAQAGERARARSAYATAAAAFERGARLAPATARGVALLGEAARAAWLGGTADHAQALLGEARGAAEEPEALAALERLGGLIAARHGPGMHGYRVLVAAAPDAGPEEAVAMLAEAAAASFCAGRPVEMLDAAQRAQARLGVDASPRARFLADTALGAAQIIGGEAAAGAASLRRAVALAEGEPALADDPQLLSWLALGPIFLREADAGRGLLARALAGARARAAIGVLPFVLTLLARDHATADAWAVADSEYREAIELARETGQGSQLAMALAGLAWLLARRDRADECRSAAEEALALATANEAELFGIWATAALGELELAAGATTAALTHVEHQVQLLERRGITDPDLWPAPELVELHLRLGRPADALAAADAFLPRAVAKGQPWAHARALRAQGMAAGGAEFEVWFDSALSLHARTPDVFETARTHLAYGERLRRARERVRAREHLGAALELFERLGAEPWARRVRVELGATGRTLRRGEAARDDELTPQELQIALLLADGRTTREAAAALFLSPKTIEYHLRHVYLKLGVNSRAALAARLREPRGTAPAAVPVV
jgi:DNA-binding CsgD family transcriptional regulator